MTQAYSNPERADDPYALPDVEVFYWNGKPDKTGEYLVWDCDNNEPMPGWYWWPCFPGCLPDGEPIGPFETEAEAMADAQSENE